jgi:hypothetical protein
MKLSRSVAVAVAVAAAAAAAWAWRSIRSRKLGEAGLAGDPVGEGPELLCNSSNGVQRLSPPLRFCYCVLCSEKIIFIKIYDLYVLIIAEFLSFSYVS